MYGEIAHKAGREPSEWKRTTNCGMPHWFREYRDTAHILEIYREDIEESWGHRGVSAKSLEHTAAWNMIREGRGEQRVIERAAAMAAEIEAAMDPADYAGYSRRRRRVWSDSDGEPCPDRILQERDTWMADSRPGRPARVYRLGMNIVCSHANQGMNEYECPYIAMGATVLATAMVLSRLGHGVEIVGCSYIEDSPTSRGVIVDHWPVKRADEPMDEAKIALLGLKRLHAGTILGGTRYAGEARKISEYVKRELGIDYAFARSWHRYSDGTLMQSDIREGLLGILATKPVDQQA